MILDFKAVSLLSWRQESDISMSCLQSDNLGSFQTGEGFLCAAIIQASVGMRGESVDKMLDADRQEEKQFPKLPSTPSTAVRSATTRGTAMKAWQDSVPSNVTQASHSF